MEELEELTNEYAHLKSKECSSESKMKMFKGIPANDNTSPNNKTLDIACAYSEARTGQPVNEIVLQKLNDEFNNGQKERSDINIQIQDVKLELQDLQEDLKIK